MRLLILVTFLVFLSSCKRTKGLAMKQGYLIAYDQPKALCTETVRLKLRLNDETAQGNLNFTYIELDDETLNVQDLDKLMGKKINVKYDDYAEIGFFVDCGLGRVWQIKEVD